MVGQDMESPGQSQAGGYFERQERMSLGDLGRAVLLGLPVALSERLEDKPRWVKALGAYAAAPALLLAEVAHGAGAALALNEAHQPAAAAAVTAATAYVAIQTWMAGFMLHCDATSR